MRVLGARPAFTLDELEQLSSVEGKLVQQLDHLFVLALGKKGERAWMVRARGRKSCQERGGIIAPLKIVVD